jgi:hypothetical protein
MIVFFSGAVPTRTDPPRMGDPARVDAGRQVMSISRTNCAASQPVRDQRLKRSRVLFADVHRRAERYVQCDSHVTGFLARCQDRLSPRIVAVLPQLLRKSMPWM